MHVKKENVSIILCNNYLNTSNNYVNTTLFTEITYITSGLGVCNHVCWKVSGIAKSFQ